MPNRAPTLGNSIMQMAMQNRQLNLQANQSFQQAAQQDAMLRSGLLNMLMGDNLSRDQMAQQESQFGREINFRKDSFDKEHGLNLNKFDQGIIEFDTMAGLEDRRVIEGERAGRHGRGHVDRTWQRSVATDEFERTLEYHRAIAEINSAEAQANAAGKDGEYFHGIPYSPVDMSNQRNLLEHVYGNSGLGVRTSRPGRSGGSVSPGGGVAGGGTAPAQTGATGQGAPSPVAPGQGSPFAQMNPNQGLLGRAARPMPAINQGAPEHGFLKQWFRDNYYNAESRIKNTVRALEEGKPVIGNRNRLKRIREVDHILGEDKGHWYEPNATRNYDQEQRADALFHFEQLTYDTVLNEAMEKRGLSIENGDVPPEGAIKETMDIAYSPERRGGRFAQLEMNMMLDTMAKYIARFGTTDVVRSLDDKGAAFAKKLEQIERKFTNGEYRFLTPGEHTQFVDTLDQLKGTIGRLGDFDPSAQMQLQQEAEAGGSGNTWMDLLLTPPAGRLGPWKLF